MKNKGTFIKIIRKTPFLGQIAERVYILGSKSLFKGSEKYWINRYKQKGSSGKGSYGKFANFKAEVLSLFVDNYEIQSVIEFGCGDGNQLALANYKQYLGLDVSPMIVNHCHKIFADDKTKKFCLIADYEGQHAELVLSLDVIYHLVEDHVFEEHMSNIFNAATKFVIIYASNSEEQETVQCPHVRHRKFSDWIDKNAPDWKLMEFIPNKYPATENLEEGSVANFYIYNKSL